MAYWAVWLAPGLAAYLEAGRPSAFGFLQGVAPHVDPSWFGIANDAAQQPAPFGEADFREGTEFVRDRGISSFSGNDGLSMEFPWDSGAIGTVHEMFKKAGAFEDEAAKKDCGSLSHGNKRTSLLTIETNQPHPLFGKGTLP